MKRVTENTKKALPLIVLCLALGGSVASVSAQQIIGISAEYGFFPYRHLANPDAGTFEEGMEIEIATLNLQASFPLVFAQGKTLVLNSIEYGRLDFAYRNWDYDEGGDQTVEVAHSVKFASFLMHGLSQKWRLIVVVAPGLASDFKGDVSSDDFTFEAVLGAIRQFSERFSFGFGAAYVRDFGEPLPLPFLAFDWKITPSVQAKGILPQNLEVLYGMSPRVDLGLAMKVAGNRYHGDPDTHGVDNPQLKHTIVSVGPTAQIHFSKWLHLNLEGGYVFVHNFEFLDGDDLERSLDLEQTGYLRAGFMLGM